MYAVVKFNDSYEKEYFEVIITSDNLEYAKKVAFSSCKEDLPKDTDDYIYRITTEIETEYLHPINKIITDYRIVQLKEYENGYKLLSLSSKVYAVIELKTYNSNIYNIDDIDNNLICNDYNSFYSYNSYCNNNNQEK